MNSRNYQPVVVFSFKTTEDTFTEVLAAIKNNGINIDGVICSRDQGMISASLAIYDYARASKVLRENNMSFQTNFALEIQTRNVPGEFLSNLLELAEKGIKWYDTIMSEQFSTFYLVDNIYDVFPRELLSNIQRSMFTQ